jgi:class 3 adenylate cyclase
MIFSLERRFLLCLLLPVAAILVGVSVVGFLYARTFQMDQWVETMHLRLEKAALQIRNQLNDKVELIELVAKAEEIPNRAIMQTFLIQQLIAKKGVKFVDIQAENLKNRDPGRIGTEARDYGPGVVKGLYTMDLSENAGYCCPVMDPNAPDRSLRIVKVLGSDLHGVYRKMTVRIGFDSFLEPIREMGLLRGSNAVLVTSTGQILAYTDKSKPRRKTLGETGDETEKKLLVQIGKKKFGTVFGPGHPPEVVGCFYKVPRINWYLILNSSGSEILAPIIRFRFYYALTGVLVLTVIILLIRFTTRYVGRSISAIAAASVKLREGDYSVRLPEEGKDEIGQLIRSFNEMTEGLKQRDLIQRTFGRYVDKTFVKELMRRPDALRLGGEKKVVTMMMADLRNFTAISEKLEPEKVIKVLNRYFAKMIDVIDRYEGIIVDFYGDSVLVFFDGMTSDVAQRAADAVKCAMEMQEAQKDFALEMQEKGLPELQMGIGIHTGEVILGNIGAETRAKYGVVGSNVNLTARIQGTASGGKIVISEQTREELDGRIAVSGDFKVCLKGVRGDKELYEVESLDGRAVAE